MRTQTGKEVAPLNTKTIVIDARAAAFGMRAGMAAAPRFVHVPGSESAYATLGNPAAGTSIVRVRDAKQAAPPRGELR